MKATMEGSMAFRAKSLSIYLTDNGRALCGDHLGASASATGRDISGQRILELTPDVLRENDEMGYPVPCCDHCGKVPSRLYVVGGQLG